jgi:hypothetical protein
VTAVWSGEPGTVAELSRLRVQLRGALRSGELPAGSDDGERLLLAFEELVSNGLRHGRPPVRVSITAARHCWLLEVSDLATDRPPVPAVDRDAARGGMGLTMVARISGAHGWAVDGNRKVVWARLAYGTTSGSPLLQRARAAVERARALAARLTVTAGRVGATLDEVAAEAAAGGRLQVAGSCRSGAARARGVAERAGRLSPPA